MEHLVQSHLGGYYISSGDPIDIEAYCEECGDSDNIIASWENDNTFLGLLGYFSGLKRTKEELEMYFSRGVSKEDIIFGLMCDFDDDRNIIFNLAEYNDISEEEMKKLIDQVSISQKEQFKLVKSVFYSNGFVRKRNNNL